MSFDKLIAALKEKQGARIRDLQQQTAAAAAAIEATTNADILRLEAAHRQKLAAAGEHELEIALAQARFAARHRRLLAEHRFAVVLQQQLRSWLPQLRRENYQATFTALVAELPARRWAQVLVNPADVNLARACLDCGRVEADPAISGGLVVISADGGVVINNTFEQRLQRSWPTLLPAIMRDLYAGRSCGNC